MKLSLHCYRERETPKHSTYVSLDITDTNHLSTFTTTLHEIAKEYTRYDPTRPLKCRACHYTENQMAKLHKKAATIHKMYFLSSIDNWSLCG